MLPDSLFRCDPILGCYRLVSRAKILSCLLHPRSPTPPNKNSVYTVFRARDESFWELMWSCLMVVLRVHRYTDTMDSLCCVTCTASDAEAPSEDQSLPIDASPTALSPGYVTDSDPDEDSEEDLKEDHADYPTDGGDDDDDEPSDDDNDDELSDDDDDDTDDEDEEPFEDEDDDEEEEEHLALANPFAVPVVDPVRSSGDTEAFDVRNYCKQT
ncbi:hypothetical protein Tco_1438508 [Tanacetum coccineum]